MKCPSCGAKLGRGEIQLCPFCGQNIERAREPARRCPDCGAKMSGNDTACPICQAGPPKRRLNLPHALFSSVTGILTALVLVGALWVLKPWAQAPAASAQPTADVTLSPSPTVTRTPTSTLTPTITPTSTPVIPAFFHHRVVKGDTLAFIAEAYAVTIEDLLAVNDIGNGEYLSVGQLLIIPVLHDVSPLTPTAIGGGPTLTPLPPLHVVEEGENLSLIAAAYGTTVEAIKAANNLGNSDLIRIGQELIVPGASYTPTVIPSPTQSKPQPTRTPSWKYAAPVLLGPIDGAVFRGEESEILLNWTSAGILESDEWYVIRVRAESLDSGSTANTHSEWIKKTSWRVPGWMYPGGEGAAHVHWWDVTVVRRSGTDTPEALSPRSSSEKFSWY